MSENYIKKPPLGLKPKWIHDKIRQREIIEAMKRYSKEQVAIPLEWIKELEELLKDKYED